MKLKDKVIIVTGAGRGLGAAIAEECARLGARVVASDYTSGELDQTVAGIRQSGGTVESVLCDVGKMSDLKKLVAEAIRHFGAIHGVVNNAGVNFVKPFLEVTEEEWNHVLNIDLTGSFFMSQLCARQMMAQGGGGSIVQIGSVHTLSSLAGAAPYDAAKHGVVGFTKAAAVELARNNIRVNLVSPGLCRTGIWQQIIDAAPSEKACVEYWNANIPAQRLIEPIEIAKCCTFLLSDDSSAITGANLMADLGMTSLLVSTEPYASKSIGAKDK
jgi:NAD(P)-dependent dehydrogenase (short-subunit alcohol dehydrogenase family)